MLFCGDQIPEEGSTVLEERQAILKWDNLCSFGNIAECKSWPFMLKMLDL